MNAMSYDKLVPDYDEQSNVANDLSASDTVEAFFAALGGGVTRVDRNSHTWVRGKALRLSQPVTVQDDVFTRDRENPWARISRVETNGDVTVVREIASQHVVGLTYDGTYLYWIQLSGDVNPGKPQPHFEVWRSPYTRDLTALNASAEKLYAQDSADGFTNTSSIVFDGVYLTSTGADTMVLRLSDRKVQTFHVSNPLIGVAPFYVDQNEIWVRYQVDGPGHAHYGKVPINWLP